MEFENDVKTVIAEMAEELNKNYSDQKLFDLSLGERLPQKDEIIDFVDELRKVTFPGFFGRENMAYANKKYFAGHKLSLLYDKLFRQIKVALSYKNGAKSYQEITEDAQEKALGFIRRIPEVQALLCKDVEAEYNGDPAANSREEIIFSYPGLFAIFVYRYAHVLYQMKVPFIPRIMTEYAHGETGIDINPGANIGEYFFIDHGTGIVIGETTDIGNNVKIYQGVTLGALSTRKGQQLSGVKRHPTIEDNVVIYANTTILGGETIIGANSVVAGNTFVTKSIPANTKVASTMPELEIKTSN
ncbi:serine acetyltransferase [Clostridium sp. AF15-41]|jgi:serine O-acetyltransferase|uniref:serine O-acetyltransferase EpsC n=1 Tax=Clostridium sp. AF15-41 TaxID=2292996 RepID=UPI000E7295DF|nr:serine O-acetyltransferase EpsC [Clostridium sp. AF15-41]RJW98739.1 serine acetyltransferase [Clostridium sp. AF15-41]